MYHLLVWVITINGDGGTWMVAAYRQMHRPNWLAWCEVSSNVALSTFIKRTRWTLSMAIAMMTATWEPLTGIIISPHRTTIVTQKHGLFVCHSCEPCKNGWTNWDAIWVVESGWPKEPCIRWGCTLAQPGEYDGTFHMQRRCWLISNYFDHLLLLLWPPYVIGGPLYFCPVVSFLLLLLLFFLLA